MKSPFKMMPKTPLMKALVGKQNRLPEHLKKAILAAPAKSYGKSPIKKDKELDEFGNPVPKGFKSDVKGETGGTAKSKQTLEKEYKTARSKKSRTPSRGKDRRTQFDAAGGDASSLARLKKTDKAEYDRLKASTKNLGMQAGDINKLTRLKELEAKRKSKGKSPIKKERSSLKASQRSLAKATKARQLRKEANDPKSGLNAESRAKNRKKAAKLSTKSKKIHNKGVVRQGASEMHKKYEASKKAKGKSPVKSYGKSPAKMTGGKKRPGTGVRKNPKPLTPAQQKNVDAQNAKARAIAKRTGRGTGLILDPRTRTKKKK